MRTTRTLLVGVLVALATLATPALADNANLDHAVNEAFKAYRSGGLQGLTDDAQMCSTGIDFQGTTESPGKQAEFCAGLEAAGTLILRHEGKLAQSDYFEPTAVLIRAHASLIRAHAIILPEDAGPYLQPRLRYVRAQVDKRF